MSHDLAEIACEIACNLMMLCAALLLADMLFSDKLFVGMRYAQWGCRR